MGAATGAYNVGDGGWLVIPIMCAPAAVVWRNVRLRSIKSPVFAKVYKAVQ